jgi:hypothetical protein
MKIDFDDDAVEQIMIAGLQKELKDLKKLLKNYCVVEFDAGDSFLTKKCHDEDMEYYRKLKAAIKMVLAYHGH